MRKLGISKYKSRFDKGKKLKVGKVTWPRLVDILSDFKVTGETFAEYEAWGKTGNKEDTNKKLDAKDVGYTIGGIMDPPLRKSFNLLARSTASLDLDHLNMFDECEIKETYGKYAYHVHSSHSHSEEKPRLRLTFPLTRDVTPEEYEPLCRMIASKLDMEMFDDCTFQASRVMFLPSVAKDGVKYVEVNEGEWIDPDYFLDMYEDIEDAGSWPRSSRVQNLRPSALTKSSPFTKPGLIGAFCRAYSIEEAILEFNLPYEPSGQGEGRYSYVPGSSGDGAVAYEDGHLHSHHESDPCFGNHNAWDLVRIHGFGDDGPEYNDTPLFKRPSMVRMSLLANKDANVQRELAGEMFDDISGETESVHERAPVREDAFTSSASDCLAAGAGPGGDGGADAAAGGSDSGGEERTEQGRDRSREEGGTETEAQVSPSSAALDYLAIVSMIAGFPGEHDTSIVEQSNRLLEELAVAALPAHEADMALQAFIGYANMDGHKSGLTKTGMQKSLKELTKALVSRGADGEGQQDIQKEFLDMFVEKYYNSGKHLKRTGKQWWTYNGTHWVRRAEEYISGQLAEMLIDLRTNAATRKQYKALAAAVGESQTSSIHNSLWAMFQAQTTYCTESTGDEKDPMGLLRTNLPHSINCENGTIRFNRKGQAKLFPSNPDDLFTSVVNANYDPDAECPNWMMFCQSAFSNTTDAHDMQRHLEELMGYTLNQARDLRAWVLLYGGTGTGKSTAGKVLTDLLGDAAKTESMTAYAGTNSHASAGLIGMQMLLDDDYSMGQLLNDGFLKTVSEEKRMNANPKGKDEFTFVCHAVPFILSNNIPATRDISGALSDRALVFPFSHKIPRSERDTRLPYKLSQELPGILARCVRAYAALVKRGDWKFPHDCTVAWKTWISQSNPLNLFVSAVMIPDEDAVLLTAADVYSAYSKWWVEENGLRSNAKMLGRNSFYNHLEQSTGIITKRHMKLGKVYEGYSLDENFVESFE